MKKRRAALYDPYLDVLGGGEKHILSIIKILDDQGYEIDIFWDHDLTSDIQNRLLLSFNSLRFIPNIFKKNISSAMRTVKLAPYDYFFYVTDGSYFFSPARNNFIFCMVPYKPLYSQTYLNKLKTVNTTYLSNSEFTKKRLEAWGVKSKVLYPYIDAVFFENQRDEKKEKIILSVGRFFDGLHVKNHKAMIDNFRKLSKKEAFKGYKLILAGGMKNEDENYFESLRNLIGKEKDIILKPNVSFKELLKLYHSAEIYWHFTGLGVDEVKNPEKTEHLGISPLEAMASSCVVFCYSAGGIKEIVKDGENGFLFRTVAELENKLVKIINNEESKKKVRTKARGFVLENFAFETFQKRVKAILFRE